MVSADKDFDSEDYTLNGAAERQTANTTTIIKAGKNIIKKQNKNTNHTLFIMNLQEDPKFTVLLALPRM